MTQSSCTNRTAKCIKSISLMKGEELLQCKKKIKELEQILKYNYSIINLHRYRQAHERFSILNTTIIELKINR
jgi:hypothetical protein